MQLEVVRLSHYQRYYNQINLLSLKKRQEVLKCHLFEALEESESWWREDFKGFCQVEHEGGKESGWKEKVKRGENLKCHD